MRRVVVTGLGLVCPLSCQVDETWKKITAGKSGIRKIESLDVSDLPSQIAGLVPTDNSRAENFFNPLDFFTEKDLRRVDKFIVYGMAASTHAIKDSGIEYLSEQEKENVGALIAAGIGGLSYIHDTATILDKSGPRRVSPFFIPASLINLASGHVSMKYGFKGPNHAVVTACSSGANAISDAARMIKCSEVDVIVAGGTEAAVCRLGLAGFAAAKSLSTGFNDTPESASRPWDKQRDGFVMAEGAGTLILEEYEHAVRRGAKIYAEVLGYGMSGDAYHITAPPADGEGAHRAMSRALTMANISPDKIGYINAHGTSTQIGDLAELHAVERLFKNTNVSMSSTKSATGHMLGAAGAVEAILSICAMNTGVLPPTLNLSDPEETSVDIIANVSREKNVDYVMSNSFGFGGTNTSLIFKKA